ILRAETPLLHCIPEYVKELVELKRFRDEIRRPPLDRIDRVLHRAETGDHNRDDAWISLAGRLDDPSPVNAWKPQVRDDDVEGELRELLQRPLAAFGLDDFEAALRAPLGHESAEPRLVVNDKQVRNRTPRTPRGHSL